MDRTRHQTPAGVTALAAGVLLGLLVSFQPERLKAPAWMAYLAAVCFAVAGAAMLARARGRSRLAGWLAGLVLLALWGMSVWLAFGEGPRQCVMRGGFLAGLGSAALCRGAFAVGAAVLTGMLVAYLRGRFRVRGAGGRRPQE